MEAALEPRRCDDFVHLRADSSHFGEADIVNLRRRQVRSRLPAHVKRICGAAIRQRRGCNGLAARRHVSLCDVVMQSLNCRNNLAGIKQFRAVRQSCLLAFGKSREEFIERLQQGARERIRWNQARNLLWDIAQHEFGRRVPAPQSFA